MAVHPQVVCFGEALVDRLGPPGGDPALAALDQLEDHLGGAPANVACALARLGTPVAFVGRLGRDRIGQAFAELFQRRGVDLKALQWDGRRPTRIVLVRRDPSGDRQFGGFAGDLGDGFADQAIEAEPLARELAALARPSQPRWLLVGTIPLASATAAAALERCLAWAEAAGVALAVDVNWRPTFWDPVAPPEAPPSAAQAERIRPLLQRAALIKCAAEEAEWLFGSPEPAAVREALPQHPAVVVTDGDRPLRWCLGPACGAQPSFPVDVIDTTGAGDSFTAGLLHRLCGRPALLGGADPLAVAELMRFGSACGALVCQGAGAIDPQPSEAAVDAFLAAASGPPGV
ncbi:MULTISPECIES: carbohydrate kinase family protein [Aphanothece]|uniref:carbohydrate kinase family protein n=1 Tax=Aphanothece TaxID=1121 RepID=UPI003984AF46